jgi:hypothetical protein
MTVINSFAFLTSSASKTYVSEKNLQCGAEPSFSHSNAIEALTYAETFRTKFPIRNTFDFENLQSAALFVRESLLELGLESEILSFNSSYGNIP